MSEEIKSKVKLFEVRDSSCTSDKLFRERIHDVVIDGVAKPVKFTYGEKTILPFAEAMKFQKEGFEVRDEKGVLLQRAPETPLETAIKLGPDQVIANLTELTGEALYARAATLPGGEKFKANSSKESMIAFLAQAVKAKIVAKADPQELPEMSDADLDALDLAAE